MNQDRGQKSDSEANVLAESLDVGISNDVIIDPSLVVAKRTFKRTFRELARWSEGNRLSKFPGNNRFRFYFPKTFQNLLLKKELNEESAIIRFFAQSAKLSDLEDLIALTDKHSHIIRTFSAIEYRQEFKWMYSSISRSRLDEEISSTLFEEWVFLMKHSWAVSRIKKPFNKLVDLGAICLQFGKKYGKKAVEDIVRKTLKKDSQYVVTRKDILRVFGKWVAVGGPHALDFLDPTTVKLSSAIGGFILLFDP